MSGMKEILDGFRVLLDDNLSMKRYLSEGDVTDCFFTFNEPAREEDIAHLEEELSIIIPDDLREILVLHNGMTLYESEFAELEFYGLDKIKEEYHTYQSERKMDKLKGHKGDYPIGYYPDLGYILLQSKKIKNGSSEGAIVVGEVEREQTEVTIIEFIDRELQNPFGFFWERV